MSAAPARCAHAAVKGSCESKQPLRGISYDHTGPACHRKSETGAGLGQQDKTPSYMQTSTWALRNAVVDPRSSTAGIQLLQQQSQCLLQVQGGCAHFARMQASSVLDLGMTETFITTCVLSEHHVHGFAGWSRQSHNQDGEFHLACRQNPAGRVGCVQCCRTGRAACAHCGVTCMSAMMQYCWGRNPQAPAAPMCCSWQRPRPHRPPSRCPLDITVAYVKKLWGMYCCGGRRWQASRSCCQRPLAASGGTEGRKASGW